MIGNVAVLFMMYVILGLMPAILIYRHMIASSGEVSRLRAATVSFSLTFSAVLGIVIYLNSNSGIGVAPGNNVQSLPVATTTPRIETGQSSVENASAAPKFEEECFGFTKELANTAVVIGYAPPTDGWVRRYCSCSSKRLDELLRMEDLIEYRMGLRRDDPDVKQKLFFERMEWLIGECKME